MCMILDRYLSFSTFVWPLCCLFFFDLRIMITCFVFSSSSFSFEQIPQLYCDYGTSYERKAWTVVHVKQLSRKALAMGRFMTT
jgi:hypothetical protein